MYAPPIYSPTHSLKLIQPITQSFSDSIVSYPFYWATHFVTLSLIILHTHALNYLSTYSLRFLTSLFDGKSSVSGQFLPARLPAHECTM